MAQGTEMARQGSGYGTAVKTVKVRYEDRIVLLQGKGPCREMLVAETSAEMTLVPAWGTS